MRGLFSLAICKQYYNHYHNWNRTLSDNTQRREVYNLLLLELWKEVEEQREILTILNDLDRTALFSRLCLSVPSGKPFYSRNNQPHYGADHFLFVIDSIEQEY